MKRCPYLKRQRKGRYIYCTLFRITLINSEIRRLFFYGRCFNPEGYENCPIKRELDSLSSKGILYYDEDAKEDGV